MANQIKTIKPSEALLIAEELKNGVHVPTEDLAAALLKVTKTKAMLEKAYLAISVELNNRLNVGTQVSVFNTDGEINTVEVEQKALFIPNSIIRKESAASISANPDYTPYLNVGVRRSTIEKDYYSGSLPSSISRVCKDRSQTQLSLDIRIDPDKDKQ